MEAERLDRPLYSLLTVAELMRHWKCKRDVVYRARRAGLVARKISGLRFRWSDILAYEDAQATAKPKPARMKVKYKPRIVCGRQG